MQITFLGTGTSQGVPVLAHDNPGLDLDEPRNWRTRTSIHVVVDGCHIQVDAAPEFRLQCLKNGIRALDHFILTHGHADHVLGMDDLRRFCDLLPGNVLPVHTTEEAAGRVRAIYPYAVQGAPVRKGYPAFDVQLMPPRLELPEGGLVESTLLPHGNIDTLGLVFTESNGRKLAYYTDCKRVTPRALDLARGADIVVLDALKPTPHATHMSIGEAIETAARIGAPRTLLTHMTFQIDYATWSPKLPPGVELAWDGLRIDL